TNSNEIAKFSADQVHLTSEGLALNCTHEAWEGKPYRCGEVAGNVPPNNAGYRPFIFHVGKGETLAFQMIAKLPPNTGFDDPAFWSDGPPYGDVEIDFPEFGAWNPNVQGWKDTALYVGWFASPHPEIHYSYNFQEWLGADPSQGYHTYTFEL